jgi:uncharacterized protein (DUF1697 family)
MREPLGKIVKKDLQPYLTQGERLRVVHGHLWVHFEHEPNRSRLMPILGSKRLGVGTVRNWNTVRRLDEMLGSTVNDEQPAFVMFRRGKRMTNG